MTWMLLTLPVIYLLNASGPALVYLAGMLFWAADTQDNGGAAWVFWPLAALLLPHTYPAVRQNPYGSRAAVLLWGGTVALCIATAITLEDLVRDRWVFVYAVLFAALYLAGENWLADATSNWQRPLRTIGGGGCVVLTFQLTYDWMWDDFTWLFWTNHLQNNYAAILSNLILALMAVAVIALLVRSARHGKTHAPSRRAAHHGGPAISSRTNSAAGPSARRTSTLSDWASTSLFVASDPPQWHRQFGAAAPLYPDSVALG